jgi:pyruvate, water dikinase
MLAKLSSSSTISSLIRHIAARDSQGAALVLPSCDIEAMRCPELNPVENIWQFLRDTGSQTSSSNATTLSSIITIRLDDISLVGGKNASLGELYCELSKAGVRVPNGFALTVKAYVDALSSAKAWVLLHELLDGLDIADVTLLAERAAKARQIVYDATGDTKLCADIEAAYRHLETQYGTDVAVAVRNSATAEDLPSASFAGQHESYLNIRGIDDLFEACRLCCASLFTGRAIVYRVNNGFDHFKVGLSVGVMKMVRSDQASSGVIFTLDTESGFHDVIFITGTYGLGENIVQGKVNPDEFRVHKPTFKQGYRAVLRRSLGQKQLRLDYATDGHTGSTTSNIQTTKGRARQLLHQ